MSRPQNSSAFQEPEPPTWARKEFAWPLSLLIGFAVTWCGLQVPIPGVAALLAAGAIAPLYLRFLERGDLPFASLIGIGWLIGSGAAGVGMAIEGDLGRVLAGFPQGRLLAERWIVPWLDVRAAMDMTPSSWPSYAAAAGFVILGLVVAPYLGGLLLLVWLALGFGALIGVAATYADAAARTGESPLSAWAWGWPPLAVVAVLALLWAGSSLALPAGRAGTPESRNALFVGIPLALLSLLLHLFWSEAWASWAVSRLPG